MVRSMKSTIKSPDSLWDETFKMTVSILNQAPSKSVPKTPYELWTGRKSSLGHLHIWEYPFDIRLYNPQEMTLNPRTVSRYFMGYPEKSKGYRFYCPNHIIRMIKSNNSMRTLTAMGA